MKIYRHGDVLLKEISALPDKKSEMKEKILAWGEVTGHTHRFTEPDSIKRYEADGKFYLEVLQTATIIHEEHKPLVILPGVYEQIKEREWDYADEEMKTVID